MTQNDLQIERQVVAFEWKPTGRNGAVVITARVGKHVLACETLNLAKVQQRDGFVERLCVENPGIDRDKLRDQLLQIAGEIIATNGPSESQPAQIDEIDISEIVRPERIITRELSAVSISVTSTGGDSVYTAYRMYLRWADGRRECSPVPPAIETPGGCRLFIAPQVVDGDVAPIPAWSRSARQAWLDHTAAPGPSEVFDQVYERLDHYLDFPAARGQGLISVMSLWTMMTYFYPVFPSIPYLYLGGPVGSGKSRVIEVVDRLAFRTLRSSNITAPALFRTLHANGGTLLFDEAERLKDQKSPEIRELLSMLLSGYKKGGCATRLESDGDGGFRTVRFDVFGPKLMACIAGLPPALASRCIHINMLRSELSSVKPKHRIDERRGMWGEIRDNLHALALERGSEILTVADWDDVCPNMNGRDFELWQPIMALGRWVENDGKAGLLALVQDCAEDLMDCGRDDQAPDCDEMLLRALADLIRKGDSPKPIEVRNWARIEEPDSFKGWSAKAVGIHLARYGLRTNKSNGWRRYNRVSIDDLRVVQDRYGLDLGLDALAENCDPTPVIDLPHVPHVPQDS